MNCKIGGIPISAASVIEPKRRSYKMHFEDLLLRDCNLNRETAAAIAAKKALVQLQANHHYPSTSAAGSSGADGGGTGPRSGKSLWKTSRILTKTLSSIEVMRSMKPKTAANASSSSSKYHSSLPPPLSLSNFINFIQILFAVEPLSNPPSALQNVLRSFGFSFESALGFVYLLARHRFCFGLRSSFPQSLIDFVSF